VTQFYAEVLRGPIGFRDNNFKPLASNDPTNTTLGWAVGSGVTATSDGDILTFSGTTGVHNLSYLGLSLNTNTYPYIVMRIKGTGTVVVTTGGSGMNMTVNLTSSFQTVTLQQPASATTTSISFASQSNPNVQVDYVYVCASTPIQLSQKDLVNGVATRTSLGNDHAELLLNNWQGKFVSGTNTIGFGDHLHIYLGQGATPSHVYGGYCELREPTMPLDTVQLHSRGFGLGLFRSKMLQTYTNTTPQNIINDVLNNGVNASNKNSLGIPSNYQLTASFVQAIGSALPLYVTNLNTAYNVLHELADLTVYQGNPALFFVDPAENLHLVPLGTRGSANWTTDPFTATYGTSIAIGKNISIVNLTQDSQSLVNRVHYYGTAQLPGAVDGLTEYSTNGAFQADWSTERLNTSTSASLSTVTSPVVVGGHSNDFNFAPGGGGSAIYPKSHASTLLDFTKLGSQWVPPVLELYVRWHVNGGATYAGDFSTVYFAQDASNRFEYKLTNNPKGVNNSVFNIDRPSLDYWYHAFIPVGPSAGNLYLNTLGPNIIAQPNILTPSYLNVVNPSGTLNWNNIHYIGLYYGGSDASNVGVDSVDMYIDGFRLVYGRYRLAYDNRSVANGRYSDMSEAYYYDPVSKDETALKAFAASELLKLRNPIIRGSVTVPLLADIVPEQQIACTIPSAGLSNQYLRCTSVAHHFGKSYTTELTLTDDFTNSRPLDRWKLANVLAEMGENAIFSRQVYDLRTAILDPSFTPLTDAYS
jgi:hypothetical protein